MINLRNNKGSVTIFVITTCLFFIVALTTVGMHMQAKKIAVDREYKKIKESYEKDVQNISEIYEQLNETSNLEVAFSDITITPSIKQISVKATLNTQNLDIKTLKYGWVYSDSELDSLDDQDITDWTYVENFNGENNVIAIRKYQESQRKGHNYLCLMVNNKTYWKEAKIPNMPEGWGVADENNAQNDWYAYKDNTGAIATVNKPKLADGMTPIIYVGEDGTSSSTLTTLTTGNKWANAMTKDGSMWVWIPRYAYRITSGYHQSGADINPDNPELGAGTIEIAFVDKNNHFLDQNIAGTVVTSGVTDSTYLDTTKWILEPGFEFGDEHLDGFWFAKFEASNTYGYGDDFATANDTTLTLQIKPNVTSWRYITSLNIFTVCQELTSNTNYEKYFNSVTNVDIHMTKNVEWGAVAYLAHSKYGLNGQEIYINNYSGYITGISGASPTASSTADDSNKYNTTVGINASTTKNIYGIYDMSGGAFEYVAGCYTEYTSKLTSNTNSTFTSKYIDVYSSYSIAKYGDAVYESSILSSSTNSWFNDYSGTVRSDSPVLARGGHYDRTSSAGLYSFINNNGNAYCGYGFRPVCIVN